MKKLLVYFVALVVCGVISALIDALIDVNFTDIGMVPHVVHKVTYIALGGIILGINKWLEG